MKKVFAILLMLLIVPCAAHALNIDLELSLLIDVSGSISLSEYNLQKQGYADAFKSTAVWDAISQGQYGAIAVNVIQWSSYYQQYTSIGWTLIDSQEDAYTFGNSIADMARYYSSVTAVQSALIYGTNQFSLSDYNATRSVIDISGDGTSNSGVGGTAGRDYALTNGVDTINGIVIGSDPSVYSYYENSVIGGTGAFAMQVDSFTDFADAIDDKLIREINPVPEPTTMILLGTGLLGLIGTCRKKLFNR